MATITGTSGSDWLEATAAGDVLLSLAGDDTLSNHFNNTRLYADAGDDILQGDVRMEGKNVSLRSFLQGGDGNDSLSGLALAVSTLSASARQTLDGGTGNDAFHAETTARATGTGSSVSDTVIWGGDGDDVITSMTLATAERGGARAHNDIRGGHGADHVTTTVRAEVPFLAGADASLQVAWAWNEVHGKAEDDTLILDTWSTGGAASATNVFRGDQGNDHLTATATAVAYASDAIALNNQMDADGNDVIQLTAVATGLGTANATAENQSHAGNGDDLIDEVATASSANGHATALTTIWCGPGIDVVDADSSADSTGGTASATNAIYGGPGADQIIAVVHAAGTAAGGSSAKLIVSGDQGDDNLSANADIANGSASTSVLGGSENDTIVVETTVRGASIAINVARGGTGDDAVEAHIVMAGGASGPAHSDVYGDDGADILRVFGGLGNVLDGGTGNDRLYCGDGSDICVFRSAGGSDVVNGFTVGQDHIKLVGLGVFSELTLTDNSDGTLITFADLSSALVVNVHALDADDFLFI